MKDYLLHTLSPGDFEELVVKICHEILGFGTISFSSGPDEGRDAFFDGTAQRFPSKADPWTGKFVSQAKHTERADASCSESDFSRIVRDETPKVEALRLAEECDNYLLYDVHSNVWEWTASEWTNDYSGRESGVEVDPVAVLAGDSGAGRVVRGDGCWLHARVVRSAARDRRDPMSEIPGQGFRVCLPAVSERSSMGDH